MSAQQPHKNNMKIVAAKESGHPCQGCYFFRILDCTSIDAQDYLNSLFGEGGCRGKIAQLKTNNDEFQTEVSLFSEGSY